jgi:hypothetical protein
MIKMEVGVMTVGICAYIELRSGMENVTGKSTETFIAELGPK